MANLIHYTTPQYKVAQTYLRANNLNTITWEYFTGDFKSVLNYLEKIANHIWEQFRIDETEIFTNIVEKKSIPSDELKELQRNSLYKAHTHVLMSCYSYDDISYQLLTINDLVHIENNLCLAIEEGLSRK